MDIYTVDKDGVIDIIDTYSSVIWNVQYTGWNDFQIILPGTEKNIAKIPYGTMLVRDMDIDGDTFRNVMLAEEIELEFDVERGWLLTVSGHGLKGICGRRIVWTQTNLTGSVEAGIRQVITENIISPADAARAIPDVILDDPAGITDTFDVQLLGENIRDWLEEVCTAYGIGWDMYISGGKYVFSLYKGTDRTYAQTDVVPVVFSPQFDNLISARYIMNKRDYKNAALVGGEGEGTSQRTATVGTASGMDRAEAYIDGGSVSSNGEIITLQTYLKMLADYGTEQLAQMAQTTTFDGEVIPEGMYTINEDYFLGDVVQIDNGFIQTTSRITELIYSEDENGSTLIPTFSTWG